MASGPEEEITVDFVVNTVRTGFEQNEVRMDRIAWLRTNVEKLRTSAYLTSLTDGCIPHALKYTDFRVQDQLLALIYDILIDLDSSQTDAFLQTMYETRKGDLLVELDDYKKQWSKIERILTNWGDGAQYRSDVGNLRCHIVVGFYMYYKRNLSNLIAMMFRFPHCRKIVVEILSDYPSLRSAQYQNGLLVMYALRHHGSKNVTNAAAKETANGAKTFASVLGHFCKYRQIVPESAVMSSLTPLSIRTDEDAATVADREKMFKEARVAVERNTYEQQEDTVVVDDSAGTEQMVRRGLPPAVDELMKGFFGFMRTVSTLPTLPEPKRSLGRNKPDDIERLVVGHFSNQLKENKMSPRHVRNVVQPIVQHLFNVQNVELETARISLEVTVAALHTMKVGTGEVDSTRTIIDGVVSTDIPRLLHIIERDGCSLKSKKQVEGLFRSVYYKLNADQKKQALDWHVRLGEVNLLEDARDDSNAEQFVPCKFQWSVPKDEYRSQFPIGRPKRQSLNPHDGNRDVPPELYDDDYDGEQNYSGSDYEDDDD